MRNSNLKYVASARPGNAFNFTKTELAALTCADLDAYTAQVEAHHALDADERKLLKKYRRQIRNRECAQHMRARKRHYTEQLETQVEQLREGASSAEARAKAAQDEAAQLRERVAYLEELLRQRSIPFSSMPRRGAVATSALFVVLFMCGLFYGPLTASSAPPLPVAPLPSTGRQLLMQEAPVPENDSVKTAMESVVRSQRAAMARQAGRSSARIVETKVAASEAAPAAASEAATALVLSPTVRAHKLPSTFTKFDRPDTEYMYCPTAHHVRSTHKDNGDAAEDFPARVSLLVPTDAFNSSALFRGMNPPPPMVEVTCAVVDIWPMWPHDEQQQRIDG